MPVGRVGLTTGTRHEPLREGQHEDCDRSTACVHVSTAMVVTLCLHPHAPSPFHLPSEFRQLPLLLMTYLQAPSIPGWAAQTACSYQKYSSADLVLVFFCS
jgi:hypothetical protein